MKFIIILAPCIFVYILCKVKTKYRLQLISAFVLYVILMNIFYNFRIIPNMTLKFKRPFNQLIYQSDYKDSLEFPDAFLELVIDGKSVYTKNDPYTIEEAEAIGYDWLYAYYHMNNPVLFLEHYGANVVKDEAMNMTFVTEEKKADFEQIGYANDMLRNVCMYYPDIYETATYFYHQWYYADHMDGLKVYVNYEGINDTDEYVFLWQNVDGTELEEFYFMTKDYYDRNIR